MACEGCPEGMSVALAVTCSSTTKSINQTVRIDAVLKNTGSIAIPANYYAKAVLYNPADMMGYKAEWITTPSIPVGGSQTLRWDTPALDPMLAGKSLKYDIAVWTDSSKTTVLVPATSCTGLVNVSEAAPTAEIMTITAS